MALSGITAVYQPSDSIAASPLPVDDNGAIEITDPKSRTAQEIINRVFAPKERSGDLTGDSGEHETEPMGDTVSISHEAMELYDRTAGSSVISMPDGATLTVSYERTDFLRVEESTQVQSGDPLVLDLDGNGLDLTAVSKASGVRFDLTGDGRAERVAWVGPDDGLLAWDRNRNGRIDSGKELFGDQHGATDGFAELARYDRDANGFIDKNDALFADLRVWQDKNQNGISETDELSGLEGLGIESIAVRPTTAEEMIAGNRVTGYATYDTAVGQGSLGEVWLNYYA